MNHIHDYLRDVMKGGKWLTARDIRDSLRERHGIEMTVNGAGAQVSALVRAGKVSSKYGKPPDLRVRYRWKVRPRRASAK